MSSVDAQMLPDKYVNMGVLLLCCYLFYCPLLFYKKKPFVKSVDTTPLFSLLIESLFQFVVV